MALFMKKMYTLSHVRRKCTCNIRFNVSFYFIRSKKKQSWTLHMQIAELSSMKCMRKKLFHVQQHRIKMAAKEGIGMSQESDKVKNRNQKLIPWLTGLEIRATRP